ncbi:unnamed protein product, partial [Nesidiocoris tenuis]
MEQLKGLPCDHPMMITCGGPDGETYYPCGNPSTSSPTPLRAVLSDVDNILNPDTETAYSEPLPQALAQVSSLKLKMNHQKLNMKLDRKLKFQLSVKLEFRSRNHLHFCGQAMPRRRSVEEEDEDEEERPQRNAANARERARMRVLSRAFCRLKTTLPWVPPDTKLSKLDTL